MEAQTHSAEVNAVATNWFRHPLTEMQYTVGVKNFADKYDAHWLIDQILCLDKMMSFFRDEYHIWNLERVFIGGKRTTQFKLELLESNEHIGYTTVIRYTDFSEDHATFHLAKNVLSLPSER